MYERACVRVCVFVGVRVLFSCINVCACMRLFTTQNSRNSVHRRLIEGINQFSESDPSVFASNMNKHMEKVVNEKYVYLNLFELSWKHVDCRVVRGKETLKSAISAPVFTKDSAFTGYFSDA